MQLLLKVGSFLIRSHSHSELAPFFVMLNSFQHLFQHLYTSCHSELVSESHPILVIPNSFQHLFQHLYTSCHSELVSESHPLPCHAELVSASPHNPCHSELVSESQLKSIPKQLFSNLQQNFHFEKNPKTRKKTDALKKISKKNNTALPTKPLEDSIMHFVD